MCINTLYTQFISPWFLFDVYSESVCLIQSPKHHYIRTPTWCICGYSVLHYDASVKVSFEDMY